MNHVPVVPEGKLRTTPIPAPRSFLFMCPSKKSPASPQGGAPTLGASHISCGLAMSKLADSHPCGYAAGLPLNDSFLMTLIRRPNRRF
jgi:hypothetical protein